MITRKGVANVITREQPEKEKDQRPERSAASLKTVTTVRTK